MTTRKTKNNIQLGLFVIIASGLLLVAIYLIGANQNLFGSSFTISTIMRDAGGLQQGNNVHYAGINVGTVEGITIISDSTLRIDLKLKDKVKSFIKKDATARITIDGIVGSTLISISPGSGAAPPIEEGDILVAEEIPGTSDLISTLGNTNLNIAAFVQDLLVISQKIKDGPGTAHTLLTDSLLAGNLVAITTNLNRTSKLTQQTMKELRDLVRDIKMQQGFIHDIIYDTTLMHQMTSVSEKLNLTISDQALKLDTITTDLTLASNDLAGAASELNELFTAVNEGEGTAHALLYDTSFTQRISDILTNLDTGTARFSEDMEALKHNFLLRRYFRKQEREARKKKKNQP